MSIPKEHFAKRKRGHWLRKTRAYTAWSNMRRRCYDPSSDKYPYYGGRGIQVCAPWKKSFLAFYRDMGECPPGMTIERRDTNGDYEPGNCKWATKIEQARNRSNNRLVSFGGETLCISAWAERIGIPQKLLGFRIRHWSIERALTQKPRKSPCRN